MDSISGLPNDLLIRILSFLPTKLLVSTSVLSKQFNNLWRSVGELHFVGEEEHDSEVLRVFLDKNLRLHMLPSIKKFGIELHSGLSNLDNVKEWVDFAVSHQVRELLVLYEHYSDLKVILPNAMFASKYLVSLTFTGSIDLDVPDMTSLPCLRSLELDEIIGLTKESFDKLLSIFHVLDHLDVAFVEDVRIPEFSVIVPSLKTSTINILFSLDRFEMKTPFLKRLHIFALSGNMHLAFDNMPCLEEAYVSVRQVDITYLMQTITSVKRLTVCGWKQIYFHNFCFNNLEYLTVCDCGDSGVQVHSLLENSPNVQGLEICVIRGHIQKFYEEHAFSWNNLHWAPLCTLLNLKTFVWSDFWDYQAAKDAVSHLLGNAVVLKNVRISLRDDVQFKLAVVKKLQAFVRASKECELVVVCPESDVF